MRTNASITLYNKYIDPTSRQEKYQRIAIQDVAWLSSRARSLLQAGGGIAANKASIYIPKARGENYLGPKEWQALSTKTGYWTLQDGDIIVKGLIDDEIIDADPDADPPVEPYTMADLRSEYDDVLEISSVDFMDLGSVSLHHWQLGAK
jgi:hypothetical protein